MLTAVGPRAFHTLQLSGGVWVYEVLNIQSREKLNKEHVKKIGHTSVCVATRDIFKSAEGAGVMSLQSCSLPSWEACDDYRMLLMIVTSKQG